MNDEPTWRMILNWSAVIVFFTLPLIVFALHLVALELPSFRFEEHVKEYGYLRRFWETDAALVLGLAGLNSWDKRLVNGAKKS